MSVQVRVEFECREVEVDAKNSGKLCCDEMKNDRKQKEIKMFPPSASVCIPDRRPVSQPV
jgi:hypothetical protein